MNFVFVRHGETNYNVKKILNNDPAQDVFLTAQGIEQSKDLANKLKDKNFEVIFVSELPRTVETAKIINEFHGAPILIDKRINDRKTGFEGRSVVDFFKAIETDVFYTKVNNGESFQEEKARIYSFLDDLKTTHNRSVLVVAHAEPLKIICGYFKNLSDSEILQQRINNAEIFEISI